MRIVLMSMKTENNIMISNAQYQNELELILYRHIEPLSFQNLETL